MKQIIIDDMKLSYKEEGEGEAILLLHGYPQNHHAWDKQFDELAKKHRVIALDWFGWGESEWDLKKDFSYEVEVERLTKVIDKLELKRFNLFAHDYGAFLALGYAEKNPNNLKRLAILNSRAHKTFNPAWFINFTMLEKVAKVPYISHTLQYMPLKTAHNFVLKAEGIKEPNIYTDNFSDKSHRAWMEKFFSSYTCKLRPELASNLKNINCPVSIIWGMKDPYLSSDIAQELLKELRDSVLIKLNGKHFIMEECPDEVLQALNELLSREPSLQTNLDEKVPEVDLSKTQSTKMNHLVNISIGVISLIGVFSLIKGMKKKVS